MILFLAIYCSALLFCFTKTEPTKECEACQTLVTIAVKDTWAALPSDHPLKSSNDGKTVSVKQQYKGRLDLVLLDVLDDKSICNFSKWKEYADTHEKFLVHDLTASCAKLIGQLSEELENLVPKYMNNPLKIRESLCSNHCKDGLWKEEEKPENREDKKTRNSRLSKEFLVENLQTNKGLKQTPSGLQYEFTEKKSTASSLCPTEGDPEVELDYIGTIPLNGTEFDSSIKRGAPATFTLSGVVPGFSEGIKLMCEGDAIDIYVPPEIGYGSTGAGNDIQPNMVLKFHIKLHVVKSGGKPKSSVHGEEL